MLIYSTVTPPFESLVERWLAPSLSRLGLLDALVVVVDHADVARGNGDFRSPGFDGHVVNKLERVAGWAREGEEPFLVTDCDVIYLNPFVALTEGLLAGKDLLLAREYPGDDETYNIGQMVIRPSEAVADFFERIAAELRDGQVQRRYRDNEPANQEYVNAELRGSALRHAPLPPSFANTGLVRRWSEADMAQLHSYHATDTLPEPGVTSLEKKHARLAEIAALSGAGSALAQPSFPNVSRQ